MPSVIARYERLIADGELRPDPEQRAAALRLTELQAALEAVPPRGSLLWRLGRAKPPAPKGVYKIGRAHV